VVSTRDPTVTVLVPAYNEERHIERTVEAILAQRVAGDLEVLVVDGRSEDRTPDIVRRIAAGDARVRLLENPERRIPNALNIGLRHAHGEFIARMDAHAVYPPTYVADAMRRFEAGDVECVSGPQLPHGEGTWSRRIALALGTRLGMGGASFRNAARETEVDTAFTGVWRRDRLNELGGWDERWPINEDAELAARIRERGGRYVCLPEMAARYVPRESLPALARQYWRYGQYRAKTARHHPIGLRRSHLLPPAVTLALVGAALAPAPWRRGARAALAAYAGAVAFATAGARGGSEGTDLRDVASLPCVFATMHLSWGAGFIVGCARFGLPVAALANVLGARGLAREVAPAPTERVDSPALGPS
jgi:succinoglycan biosynthesis protein ExoA